MHVEDDVFYPTISPQQEWTIPPKAQQLFSLCGKHLAIHVFCFLNTVPMRVSTYNELSMQMCGKRLHEFLLPYHARVILE